MACKVEDTIKKSREILCAAYNIKNPTQPTTQDDKVSRLLGGGLLKGAMSSTRKC